MAPSDVTVLLTGASGLLGTGLRRTAPTRSEVVPLVHHRRVGSGEVVADLRDREAVAAAISRIEPGLVIHAAFAHDRPSIVDATRHLVDAAAHVGADVIFVSSEAVFSGDGAPRTEADPPDPVWDYGRWKVEAEQISSEGAPGAAIVRLPLITSLDPEDHMITAMRAALEGGPPTVWFTDEIRQPAAATELSRALWAIAAVPREERAGVWHLPGAERLSRYEIAERAASAIGLDRSTLVAAPTPSDARRPRDLHLTGARAEAEIGWRPSPIHPSASMRRRFDPDGQPTPEAGG